jgi:hypothetical protein
VVRLLLAHQGIEVNKAEPDGCTAMHAASVSGHLGVVQLLLARLGVDVSRDLANGMASMSILPQPVALSVASVESGTTTSAASLGSSADAAGAGEERRCAYPGCLNGAESMCDACKLVVYCSRACQKQHWPAHKVACKLKRQDIKE